MGFSRKGYWSGFPCCRRAVKSWTWLSNWTTSAVLLRRKKLYLNRGMGFPGGSVVKTLPASSGDTGSIPDLKIPPGEGNGNHSSFLPGKLHGQRSLAGCSPWGCRHNLSSEQQHVEWYIEVSIYLYIDISIQETIFLPAAPVEYTNCKSSFSHLFKLHVNDWLFYFVPLFHIKSQLIKYTNCIISV